MITKSIVIDSRASGYSGEPVRIMAVSLVASGKIQLQKTADWNEPPQAIDDRVLITDSPRCFSHWDMIFDEKQDMKALITSYKQAVNAGFVRFQDELRRYDPSNVMQMRKLDERGQVMDFDSMSFNNGHLAVMLAVWVAYRAYGGFAMLSDKQDVSENTQDDMLPFSC